MSEYIIESTDKNNNLPGFSFHQASPNFVCGDAGYFYSDANVKRGKCRNPRCSLKCRQAHARKIQAVMAERLRACGLKCYRGNLSLLKDAGPDVHRKVKQAFLRRLNYIRKRDGITIEVFCILHITDATNAHYDVVVYSNVKADGIIRNAWKDSGGARPTCKPLPPSAIDPVAAYNAKTESTYNLLPVKRCEPGYLDHTWGTAGFWGGESIDEIWRRLYTGWFGSNVQLEKEVLEQQTNSQSEVETPSEQEYERQIDAFVRFMPHEPREALRRVKEHADRNHIPLDMAEQLTRRIITGRLIRNLPSNPEDAVTIGEYASRWGLSSEMVASMLCNHSCVHYLDGELVDGMYVWNGVYKAL